MNSYRKDFLWQYTKDTNRPKNTNAKKRSRSEYTEIVTPPFIITFTTYGLGAEVGVSIRNPITTNGMVLAVSHYVESGPITMSRSRHTFLRQSENDLKVCRSTELTMMEIMNPATFNGQRRQNNTKIKDTQKPQHTEHTQNIVKVADVMIVNTRICYIRESYALDKILRYKDLA